MAKEKDKSLESWIWDAAYSIRGAKGAPKYKDFILPLIFTKRLCDVFPVLLPPQDQQKDIVDACHSIDGKIRVTRSKITQLQDLFRTLLHELMTAKTRVNDLTMENLRDPIK